MNHLTREQYDGVLRLALRQLGLDHGAIERLLAARWPMTATDLIGEANGRGLLVGLDDIEEYLRPVFAENETDECPADAIWRTLFLPEAAERFFEWACETGRARLTPVGEMCGENPDVVRGFVGLSKFAEN